MHTLKLLIWALFKKKKKKRFRYVSTTAFTFFFGNHARKKNYAEHLNETLLRFFSESADNKQDVNKYNRVFSLVSLYIQSFHAAQISSMALSELSASRPDAAVRFWQPPPPKKQGSETRHLQKRQPKNSIRKPRSFCYA